MIRALCWLLMIEPLMRRLDRRPSMTAHLPPLKADWLGHHIGPASAEPPPILLRRN